mmetsp:Transcript_104592/g.207698  ORF Transcript_104592/g.207698 Transcript_104592/m.207698 type:complete len:173 (-) Transcript_104592:224-742(-)
MSFTNVLDDEAEYLFKEDYGAFVEDQLLLLHGSSCSQADPGKANDDVLSAERRLSTNSLASMSTAAEGSTHDEWLVSARPSTESSFSQMSVIGRRSAPASAPSLSLGLVEVADQSINGDLPALWRSRVGHPPTLRLPGTDSCLSCSKHLKKKKRHWMLGDMGLNTAAQDACA